MWQLFAFSLLSSLLFPALALCGDQRDERKKKWRAIKWVDEGLNLNQDRVDEEEGKENQLEINPL